MVKLSKRLSHLADMVSENMILADVGTDHGYIPIYLVQTGKIQRAFAMDIRKGPILRAQEHIQACGLGDYIETRLSDGVTALERDEADAILIAGMGGSVMLHILEEGENVVTSAKELILQPQSEIPKVREYLYQKGYAIDREDMVFEDGKYYSMMHVIFPEEQRHTALYTPEEWQMIYRYGENLLIRKNDVLYKFLLHTISQYEGILKDISDKQQTVAITERKQQIETELAFAKGALAYF